MIVLFLLVIRDTCTTNAFFPTMQSYFLKLNFSKPESRGTGKMQQILW